VRPETVVLELCATRARRLQAGVAPESTLVELLRLLQAPGSVTSKALALGLRGMYGLWRHAGLEPGGEFTAAMQEAAALSPSAAVVYGDQEASVTLQRLAATITLPALLSALGSAFSPSRQVPPELAAALSGKLSAEEAVEALKDRETVRALVAYTRDAQPAATRVLLDERDDILARALRSAGGSRVVGVVGLAHVDGIEQRWGAMDAGGEAKQSRTDARLKS